MATMVDYWERLKPEMDKAKMDITALSEALEVSYQAVVKVRDGGSFGSKNNLKAAKLFGLNPEWLATGKGARQATSASASPSNIEDHASRGAVPRISWVQAGCWADVADPYQPGDAEEWLPCPVKHGPRTYCLTVRGQSMFNPEGRPSYAEGDIIFVDPDRDANHGDRVIVRLDDQQEATFKQLLIEDGRKLLKALNPNWPERYMPINGNATICGVIIGKWVPE